MGMKRRTESRRSLGGGPGTLAQALEGWLAAHGGRERLVLARLWKEWDSIMGEDVAPLARPLGHRHQTLLLGAEDNLAMQELTFHAPEVLRRANAFMATAGQPDFFTRVEAHLPLGRETLGEEALPRPALPEASPRPRLTGLAELPPGPVKNCYEVYVRASL